MARRRFLGIPLPFVLAYTACSVLFGAGCAAAVWNEESAGAAIAFGVFTAAFVWIPCTLAGALFFAFLHRLSPAPRDSGHVLRLARLLGLRGGEVGRDQSLYWGRSERGRRIELSVSRGRVRIALAVAGAAEVRISPETALHAVGKALGLVREIETGDEVFDRSFLIQTVDDAAAQEALAASRVRDDIVTLFHSNGVERLEVTGTRLIVELPVLRLGSDRLLVRLEALAGELDRVPLEGAATGAKRFALVGKAKVGRCSYCHDDVTGAEPDLVACPRCRTIIHDACFRENGRCPVLGCGGRSTEAPRQATGA